MMMANAGFFDRIEFNLTKNEWEDDDAVHETDYFTIYLEQSPYYCKHAENLGITSPGGSDGSYAR